MSTPTPSEAPPVTPEAAKAIAAVQVIATVANAASVPPVVSPPFSFKGWLLSTELQNNARFFKNLLNVDVTVLGLDQVTAGKLPVISGHVLLIVGASVIVAVLKVAFDAAQYYISRQTVPPTPQA